MNFSRFRATIDIYTSKRLRQSNGIFCSSGWTHRPLPDGEFLGQKLETFEKLNGLEMDCGLIGFSYLCHISAR